MKAREYANLRAAEGVGTSAAVEELAALTGATVRTVYRWLEGDKEPQAVGRLLDAFNLLTDEQRRVLSEGAAAKSKPYCFEAEGKVVHCGFDTKKVVEDMISKAEHKLEEEVRVLLDEGVPMEEIRVDWLSENGVLRPVVRRKE